MIAVDSSVVVAGFASWHERHEQARTVLDRRPAVVAHSAVESYSVLTRLPPPHRAAADVVSAFLRDRLRGRVLDLPSDGLVALIEGFAAAGIAGGATYDASIATAALRAGATLVTCDRRAEQIYRRVGVDIAFL